MSARLAVIAVVLAVLGGAPSALGSSVTELKSDGLSLLPPNGQYATGTLRYTVGVGNDDIAIILGTLGGFGSTTGLAPQWAGGVPNTFPVDFLESNTATLGGTLVINSTPNGPIFLTGDTQVILRNRTANPPLGTDLATEMLQLNLSGGGYLIRESPPRASPGSTTIVDPPTTYTVDSFFSVFTELSADGGATWSPALGAATFTLNPVPAVPEPSALALAALSGAVLLRKRRSARR